MSDTQEFNSNHAKALIRWFQKNQRDFPWRKNPDPYLVWLAEIMSQQTQMASLMPYFFRFIEKFPNVKSLAQASEQEVLAMWTGLGYYSRARNLHKAAKQMDQQKKFPKTAAQWLELPGVGPYTAAAVASQCFEQAIPVWDGNVQRVCSRVKARSDVFSNDFRSEMLIELQSVMKGSKPSQFNQAMMELGALVCRPQNPACEACPIQTACKAYALKKVAEFPPPKPRKKQVELKPRVLVRLRRTSNDEFEVYLERRSESHWFGGMWDFPSELGGVKNPVIFLNEFAHLESKLCELGAARHSITHHKIELKGFAIIERQGETKPVDRSFINHGGIWLSLDAMSEKSPMIPLSTTSRKILRLLTRWLETSAPPR